MSGETLIGGPERHPWPKGAVLDGTQWIQLRHVRVLNSRWWLLARRPENAEAGLIGFGLWLKAMECDPAGVLPDDDELLCDLAGLGADLDRWRRLRPFALYGWRDCEVALEVDAAGMPDFDGPALRGLWHPEVHDAAAKAMGSHKRQRAASAAAVGARERQLRKRVRDGLEKHRLSRGAPPVEAVEWIADWLDRDGLYASQANLRAGWTAYHTALSSEVAKIGMHLGKGGKSLA